MHVGANYVGTRWANGAPARLARDKLQRTKKAIENGNNKLDKINEQFNAMGCACKLANN